MNKWHLAEKFKLPVLVRDTKLEAGPMLCVIPFIDSRTLEWTVDDLANYGWADKKAVLWADGELVTNQLNKVDAFAARFEFVRELSKEDLGKALDSLIG